jgi:DNA-directed RNA polymerase subunit RPC12/RpoP/Zn-finger nucleic acid-binding protein
MDERSRKDRSGNASAIVACPGCGQPMQTLRLARKPHGDVDVDFCVDCQMLWFDAYESVQLTPGSTLRLFEAIHARSPAHRHPLPETLPCPRCRFPLTRTQDVQRTTRFSYHRCEAGHGRLTPFFQFLREKDFIRPLPPDELERLKAQVRTIRCSSCGAPIELATQTACGYCRAPIVVLDPDAVRKTVAALETKEAARTTVDVVALVDGLLDAQRREREFDRRFPAPGSDAGLPIDLVDLGLTALAALFRARG